MLTFFYILELVKMVNSFLWCNILVLIEKVYLSRWLQHLYDDHSYEHPILLTHSSSVLTLIQHITQDSSRLFLILVQNEHHPEHLQVLHSPALYTPLQHQPNPRNQHTLFPTDLYEEPPLYQHSDCDHQPTLHSHCPFVQQKNERLREKKKRGKKILTTKHNKQYIICAS